MNKKIIIAIIILITIIILGFVIPKYLVAPQNEPSQPTASWSGPQQKPFVNGPSTMPPSGN